MIHVVTKLKLALWFFKVVVSWSVNVLIYTQSLQSSMLDGL